MSNPMKFFFAKGRFVALFCLMSAITACATIPQQEFGAYLDAVNAARVASDSILVDYQATRKAVDALDSTGSENDDNSRSTESEDPLVNFQSSEIGKQVNGEADIQARVAAWDAINRYNDALTALASGQSADSVKRRVGALSKSISTVATTLGTSVPGLGLAVPAISEFLRLAEQARSRTEFIEAVTRASPIIEKIVNEVFIPDTDTFAGEKEILTDGRIHEANKLARSTARSMAKLSSEYIDPAPGSDMATKKAAVEAEMLELLKAFQGEFKIKRLKVIIRGHQGTIDILKKGLSEYKIKTPPPNAYTELVQSQLEQLLGEMRKADLSRQQQYRIRNAYAGLLNSYVALLRQVNAAMKALQSGVDRPPDLQAVAREIVGSALTVRAEMAAIRKIPES